VNSINQEQRPRFWNRAESVGELTVEWYVRRPDRRTRRRRRERTVSWRWRSWWSRKC